jgi:hypothetical protein
MLIIAAVLGAASVFGSLIISQIQQSRLIDQSIQAYYIAESGAERAMYQTRKREAIPACDGVKVCNNNNGYCAGNINDAPCVTSSQGTLGSKFVSDWLVVANNETETIVRLDQGNSFQLDLFTPLQVKDANIDLVRIEELSSSAGDQQDLTLYGEFTNLTRVLNLGCSDPNVFSDFIPITLIPFSDPPVYAKDVSSLNGRDILGTCAYIFKVSLPLKSVVDWTKLKFNVLNGAQSVNIPSRLVIESSAVYGNSSQKVTIRTPMRAPLSGLYDFVLFAEEQVIKEQ